MMSKQLFFHIVMQCVAALFTLKLRKSEICGGSGRLLGEVCNLPFIVPRILLLRFLIYLEQNYSTNLKYAVSLINVLL